MFCFKRQQSGFSLLELTFVLAILGVLSQGFFAWKQDVFNDGVIRKTIDGFALIDEALYAHRVARRAWPMAIDNLSDFLPGFTNANGTGRPYALRAQGANIVISTHLETPQQRDAVLAEFPTNGTATGTTGVEVGIPLPGLEIAHQQFLLLNGSRPMTGHLNMNDRSITNANTVNASRVAASKVDTTVLNAQRSTISNITSTAANITKLRIFDGDVPGGICQPGQFARNAGDLLFCNPANRFAVVGQKVEMSFGWVSAGSLVTVPPGYTTNDCLIDLSDNLPVGNVHIDNQNFHLGATPDFFRTKFQLNNRLWEDHHNTSTRRTYNIGQSIRYKMLCTKS